MRPALKSFWIDLLCYACVDVACYVTMVAWGQRLRARGLTCCTFVCVDFACHVIMVAWGQGLRACGLTFCALAVVRMLPATSVGCLRALPACLRIDFLCFCCLLPVESFLGWRFGPAPGPSLGLAQQFFYSFPPPLLRGRRRFGWACTWLGAPLWV